MMLATTNDPATAVATLGNGKMLTSLGVALYGSPLQWVVMLAPLGMVFFLSARIHTMSVSAAQTAFWVFAGLMGLSLSSIFLVYTGAEHRRRPSSSRPPRSARCRSGATRPSAT